MFPSPLTPGSAPPLPALIIGRDEAMQDLKTRLGIDPTTTPTPQAGLTPALYKSLVDTLLRCGSFASDAGIRNLFIDQRIHPWQQRLPHATSPQARVETLIAFLYPRFNQGGENGLSALLSVLIDNEDEADKCRQDLQDLLPQLTPHLPRPAPPPSVTNPQVLTAVRGWPGVGKTTLAAALAHDPDIAAAFPDGVLWASLGQTPSLLSELAAWGRALGSDDILRARDVGEASARLAGLLRDQRRLLIVDDVWETEHAEPFKVGGRHCALLLTTRINRVAQEVAPTPNDIYKLAILTDKAGLELLTILAPTVVKNHLDACQQLIQELEGLPLAIQVAGRLLQVEASYGFGVTDLIAELQAGAKLIEAIAPADRTDLANETTPTVAALLQRSTDHLSEETRDYFAYLGAFAPKPATFDINAMKAVWLVDDAKPVARELVDRGLLEPVPATNRFQMHALLVTHAKSLLT